MHFKTTFLKIAGPSASLTFSARCLSGAGLAMALTGCLSPTPKLEMPPLPVAETYADARAHRPASSIAWKDYFADEQLRHWITLTLANNRDLRIAVLRMEEARSAYRIQRAEQFPVVGVDASGTRSRTPGDFSITGQPVTGSQYQVGLGVSTWELDFWGRVRSLKDSALESYLATDAARRASTLALVSQVANGYLTLRELDERVFLAHQTILTRQESFRIFTRRYEVGAISKLDLIQVETLLTQAQTLGAQLEQSRASQLHALILLIGTPVELASEEKRFDDQALFQELQPGLPSDLLIERPDIVAAEHRLRAANANIGAARAAFFPNISLTGGLGTASAELGGLFDSGSLAWNFKPTISLPIFDGGRRRVAVDLTEVRRDIAVAEYEKTIQTAFSEVLDALSSRRWLDEQVQIQKRALATQQERARLSKLSYDNGASPYFEVLDAQRDLLAVEQQLVQTRRLFLSSQIALYAALGGGSGKLESVPVRQDTR